MRSILFILFLFVYSFNVYANKKKSKNIHQNDLTYINIEPSVFLSSIKIYDIYNNANGNINSKYNYGLNLSWNEALNFSLQYKVILDYKRLSFKKQLEDIVFINNSLNTFSFGLGLKKSFSRNFIVDLDLLIGHEFFIRFPNSDSVLIDKTYALSFCLNTYYAFYNTVSTKLAVEISPVVIFPSNVGSLYMTKTSYGANLGVSLRYRIIKILISYRSIIKDTEILNQNQKDIIFKGRLSWEI